MEGMIVAQSSGSQACFKTRWRATEEDAWCTCAYRCTPHTLKLECCSEDRTVKAWHVWPGPRSSNFGSWNQEYTLLKNSQAPVLDPVGEVKMSWADYAVCPKLHS